MFGEMQTPEKQLNLILAIIPFAFASLDTCVLCSYAESVSEPPSLGAQVYKEAQSEL